MIQKILGLGDLLCIFAILFAKFLPLQIIILAAFYLIIKGMVFALGGDIVSFMDIGIGIYLLLTTINISSTFVTTIAVIFLAQKAIFSLLG